MITKLSLENFGRFIKENFTFAPITIFLGKNESGKTTLFDALLDAISSPKANTEQGKILVKRYGKNRRALPKYEGEPLSITEKDFMNLFAVRSGSISLEIEQNSQWMNQVKASLFSGGIDPQTIARDLNDIIVKNTQGSLRREEQTINAELERLENDKKNYEDIRQECFEEEKHMSGAKGRMEQTEEEISGLKKKYDELEKSLFQQRLLQQEKDLNKTLADIAELRRNKAEQEKHARLNDAGLDELRKLETEFQSLRAGAEKAEVQEEDIRRALSDHSGEKARYNTEKSRGDSIRILADNLRDTLLPREKLVSTKTHRIWRKPFLIAAALFLSIGLPVFFLTDYGWAALAAVVAAVGICVAIAPTRQSREDTSALDDAVRAAGKRWKEASGEDLNSYEEILITLDRAVEKSRTADNNYLQAIDREAGLEKNAAECAIRKAQCYKDAESAQRQLRSKLEEAGAADINAYAMQLGKKKFLVERGRELEGKLGSLMETHVSPDELEDSTSRKIAEIREKITETEISPNELRVKENLLRETKEQLEILQNREKESLGSLGIDQGTIRERLRGLPEKIVDCEKGINERTARLAEIDKLLRAAKIARELFSSIADDTGRMLEELSGEIGTLFSAITDEGRKVSMENFSMANINVDDAQGTGRDSSFLSTGTRDAFLLAARLTLARKSTDSNAIIVLDEPFLALDRSRTGRALSILKEFHVATLWQLVLFTKDEETVDQAREVFGTELCVHELA